MDKKEFIKYLENKGHTIKNINQSIKYVEQFFARIKKEELQITKPDVLKFLEYLKKAGKSNSYRQMYLTAVNHYFTFLYKNEQIAENPCLLLKIRGIKRKTLYNIYTSEELETLFDNYYQLFVRNLDYSLYRHEQQRKQSVLSKERNALIFSILINQGITTGELEKLELNDIDFVKANIKIEGGQHSNGRILPLKASQIGLIMHYLQNIRPQLLEYHTNETNKLILALPVGGSKTTDSEKLNMIFVQLTKQLKTIDKQFLNFKQVRASVITFWLKTCGLRKTQYLAGHRYISSTESYLPNNLDNLIDDINKLHPF
jgi:site-specific recombinase XerD